MKSGRYLMLVLMLVGLPASVARPQDSTKSAPSNPPRLEVPETSFDFGYVPRGASIAHAFWLKNVGGEILRITDVRPG